ncbi:MAG: MBL fold metallo-hydrolase [Albidovulum sp.]|nr:MBL fold metallo-hydrolase [Albidovulum sp.]
MQLSKESLFDLDFDPPVGYPETVKNSLKRIVAPNASPMTFRGTNTYLLGTNSIAVIDPGPDDPTHLEAILSTIPKSAEITEILVTHAHTDHSAASAKLSKLTGAPVKAFGDHVAGRNPTYADWSKFDEYGGGKGVDSSFRPDSKLGAGDKIRSGEWTVEAIWTPGHFGNHLCFSWHEGGAIFSGDILMGWSTTLISPPDGHIGDFMNSLDILSLRSESLYLPGHGAPIYDPQSMIAFQARHRRNRESQILKKLVGKNLTARRIAESVYDDVAAHLIPAATCNVFAHLLDLRERGLVKSNGRPDFGAKFSLS